MCGKIRAKSCYRRKKLVVLEEEKGGGEEEGEESFEDITRKGGNVRDDVSERVGATHKKPWERMVKRRKRRRRRREFNCIFNCWAETW